MQALLETLLKISSWGLSVLSLQLLYKSKIIPTIKFIFKNSKKISSYSLMLQSKIDEETEAPRGHVVYPKSHSS